MNSNYIITIGRQFGSGGREIGEALAKKLGIPFYDKELISMAAKESGQDAEVFDQVDERATNSLLYSLSMGLYNFGNSFTNSSELPVNDRLYILQHQIIKKLADEGPCVIVGRCADYVLKDKENCVNVFIHANMEYRKKRAIEIHDVKKNKAEQIINKTDKIRANYYGFYSGQKWGFAQNYDICIDSSKLTTDQAVALIESYVNIRYGE